MKFREFTTSSGKIVVGGKSAENNEDLIKQVEDYEVVLHTEKPGSPFVNIKCKRPSKSDVYEAAVFCAVKSQDWRDNKKDIVVHVFRGKDIYKERGMKLGTFGVRKKRKIVVKKGDVGGFGK